MQVRNATPKEIAILGIDWKSGPVVLPPAEPEEEARLIAGQVKCTIPATGRDGRIRRLIAIAPTATTVRLPPAKTGVLWVVDDETARAAAQLHPERDDIVGLGPSAQPATADKPAQYHGLVAYGATGRRLQGY